MKDKNGNVYKIGSRVNYYGINGTVTSIEEESNSIGVKFDVEVTGELKVVNKNKWENITAQIFLALGSFSCFLITVLLAVEYFKTENYGILLVCFVFFIFTIATVFGFVKSFEKRS